MEVLAYVVVAALFFGFGVLFGRKNKKKVEAALAEANAAHARVVDQLEAAKAKLSRKPKA